jgi:hypothetical protein
MDFARLIASTCTLTGWTWDYVADNMTLPRLDVLVKCWRDDDAPVALLLNAYFKAHANKAEQEKTEAEKKKAIAEHFKNNPKGR